jgi:hypothetical protein
MANNSQPLNSMTKETLDRTSNTMNTPIPCRRAVASSRLPLHPVHRILTAGLSALLAGFAFAPAASAQAAPPAAPTYERLKSFGGPSPGGDPEAGLIQGADGALYGTAMYGGSSGN